MSGNPPCPARRGNSSLKPVGETKQEPRSILNQRVLLGIAIGVAVVLVAGAVLAVGRVRSLDSELAASEARSKSNSDDLRERITSLEDQLAETRAALEEQETLGTTGQERLEVLESQNRALRNCATEARPRGRPRVTLLPSHGTPGTRVEVVGHCFTSRFWKSKKPKKGTGIGLWTQLDSAGNPNPDIRRGRCELVAGRAGTFEIGGDGRMRGHFVVPRSGRCAGSKESDSIVPGRYDLVIGCRQCAVARFQVTTSTTERNRLPDCSGRDWRLALEDAARMGGAVLVGIRIESNPGARCRFRREVTLTLTGADGSQLSVEGNPVQSTIDAAVGDEITALWGWSNWCGAQGSFSVRAAAGEKTASRTIGAGPRCDSRKRSSALRGIPQWTKGVNP